MTERHPWIKRAGSALGVMAIVGALAGTSWLPGVGNAQSSHGAPTSEDHHAHHSQHGDNIVFSPAPPVFPPGAEMAVLQGDPSVAGAIFTVRLRFPDGYVIPPHRHPTDEHVTVIRGTFLVGLGDTFDEDAFLPPLRRSDFITAPANVSHFAKAKGRTEVQVHGIGPFQMTYVNPEDDPQR